MDASQSGVWREQQSIFLVRSVTGNTPDGHRLSFPSVSCGCMRVHARPSAHSGGVLAVCVLPSHLACQCEEKDDQPEENVVMASMPLASLVACRCAASAFQE